MKQLLSDLFRPFIGLLLILAALVLLVLIAPFAASWKIVASLTESGRKSRDILTALGKYFKDIAISYDQLGNTLYGGFFQRLFIRKGAADFYPFSDEDDTVSEVLGWNELMGTLSHSGVLLASLLNRLSPNHTRGSVESAVKKAKLKLERYKALQDNR